MLQNVKYRKIVVIYAALIVFLGGCENLILPPEIEKPPPPPDYQPIAPKTLEFTIKSEDKQIFSEVLSLAHELQLDPVVVNPSSNILRFEHNALSATDLDKYCVFPVRDAESGNPLDTFNGWDLRLRETGLRLGLRGMLSLSVLLTEESPGLTRFRLNTNWAAVAKGEKKPCNSTGVFESKFKSRLLLRLGYL